MDGLGITTVGGAAVSRILTGNDGRVRAVVTDDAEYPADVVVLGIGVRPETALAEAAGLPLGPHGGLLTDLSMRVRGHDDIWAGGDCVEVLDLITGTTRHIALGTHANKHGQVIGANVGGDYGTFPGVVGTAVSKVCDREIARTGLREKDARAAGLRYVSATIESTGTAGYLPGARLMTVKMLAERRTGQAARRADRGRRGRREAGGHRGGRPHGPDDGRADDGAGPGLRAAVLPGLGPGPGGGPQGDGGGPQGGLVVV